MISAVVLAAGKSTRMGRSKANLPIGGGHTFLSRVVQSFREAGIEDVVVVIGHDAQNIEQAFARTGAFARFVINPDYERGQLSSLIRGLNAIDRPGIAAALITLVDVPLVAARTIDAVVRRWMETKAPIVRPVRGDEHGHPVLVSHALFDSIRRADPSVGAKGVVRTHASATGDVEVDDDGAFLDIDTDEQYRRFVKAGESDG